MLEALNFPRNVQLYGRAFQPLVDVFATPIVIKLTKSTLVGR